MTTFMNAEEEMFAKAYIASARGTGTTEDGTEVPVHTSIFNLGRARRRMAIMGRGIAKPFVAIDHKMDRMNEKIMDIAMTDIESRKHKFLAVLKWYAIEFFVAFLFGFVMGLLNALIFVTMGALASNIFMVLFYIVVIWYSLSIFDAVWDASWAYLQRHPRFKKA